MLDFASQFKSILAKIASELNKKVTVEGNQTISGSKTFDQVMQYSSNLSGTLTTGDSSNKIPTTAWVQGELASSSSGVLLDYDPNAFFDSIYSGSSPAKIQAKSVSANSIELPKVEITGI